ncbi:MAG: bifunctional diaminohydroxyphosphoribosylaminopyrimidine deaminase/5-amino-6-(5-phosphoribosylamino)uracil reductase RibD [Tissierellia bacterium]|nr:bifunctional diaminohydroxyphosphoribosylaminopyrimidine deaminase/5-amino-6-(5-phosphoribosylamino)uracil reductase RibD [Tissierellia bacterium]
MNDKDWMKKCFTLARKSTGKTGSNPLVGAVIVKNQKEISSGYHRCYGSNHAEVEAILGSKESVKGATLYVTLEPCCHYGKTPPCTKAIIESGIEKVIVSVKDIDPKVSGKGIQTLRDAGIKVVTGVLEEEGKKFYRDYFQSKTLQRPKVILKVAMSLDGKIATRKGESKWITNEKSREDSHRLRAEVDGILVGIGTVLMDDPYLTNRSGLGGAPSPIILDTNLRIPLHAKVLKNEKKPYILTGEKEHPKMKSLIQLGATVLKLPLKDGRVDLKKALEELYSLGFGKILVEGGSTVFGSFVDEKLLDEIIFYIAPILIGGKDSKNGIEGLGFAYLKDTLSVEGLQLDFMEGDIKVTGRVGCLQD